MFACIKRVTIPRRRRPNFKREDSDEPVQQHIVRSTHIATQLLRLEHNRADKYLKRTIFSKLFLELQEQLAVLQ